MGRLAGWPLAGAAVLALSLAGGQQPAAAQGTAPAQAFAVAAGPLDAALLAFAHMARLRLAADARMLAGRHSGGVRDRLPPAAALDQVLAGTGLTGRIEQGTIVVARPIELPMLQVDSEAPPVPPNAGIRLAQAGGAITLPPIDVASGIPSSAVIGPPPPPYAGGQVARGARTGLFGNRDNMDVPFSQRSYTRDAIEDVQARTLTDVLAQDPTLRPVTYGGTNFEDFLIRGFTVDGRSFLFDGLAGLTQNRRQAIPVEALERVEVLNGPSAFLNGPPLAGGIGGTVNLIPKRATDTPVTDLLLRYGSAGNVGASVDLGRRFGPDNAFGVRLNAGTRAGGTAVRDQREQQDFGFLALDWRGERARVSLSAGVQRYDIDGVRIGFALSPTSAVPRPPRGDRLYGQPWEAEHLNAYMTVLRGEYDIAPNWTAGLALAWARYEDSLRYTDVRVTSPDGTGAATPSRFDFYNERYVGEATLRGTFDTGPLRHRLAFSATSVSLEGGTGFVVGTPRATNIYAPSFIPESALPRLPSFGRNSATDLRSFGVGDEIGLLGDRVLLTAGFRWVEQTTRAFNGQTGARTSRYYANEITPAVGLVVKPTPALSLYANYAQALEQGGIAPITAVNAGEILPPLLSEQVEVGAKYDLGSFAVTAALFQIERANNLTDPTTRRFSTDGRQRHRGAELVGFGEPIPGLRILGGLTLLDAEVTSSAGGQFDGRRPVSVPRVYGSIRADWDVPFAPGLAVNGMVTATGDQTVNPAGTQKIDSYALLNLGARYTLDVRGTPVVVRFDVLNVTDEDYYVSAPFGALNLGYPRTFLLSTQLRF